MAADNDPNILKGPDIPFVVPKMTLGSYIYSKLKSHNPKSVLMREAEGGRFITVGDFLTLSIKVTVCLQTHKLKPGDIICISTKASIDTYVIATGILFLGGIVFPVDCELNPEMLRTVMKGVDIKFTFVETNYLFDMNEAFKHNGSNSPIVVIDKKGDEKVPPISFEYFMKSSADVKNFSVYTCENCEDETAMLVCSSGSTGPPKAVMLTHKNLLYQCMIYTTLSQLNKTFAAQTITFSFFYWISGIIIYMHIVCVNVEMTIVQDLDTTHILEVIQRNKPVWGMFLPKLIKNLLEDPNFKKYNVSSLIYMVTGGCPLQKLTAEKLKKLWGNITCRQSYGISEAGGAVTGSDADCEILSIGKPFPGVKVKIVNRADNSILGPNQEGEIVLSSPSIMKGYYKMEDATKQAVKNGWYESGDIGYFNEKGIIYIKGRIKEMIKYNKLMIFPSYLEDLLLYVPGVCDAGVVGMPVDDENALLTALIVKFPGAKVTEADIIKAINDQVEDHQKLRGGVYFVENVPRCANGKMKRVELMNIAKKVYKKP